MNLITKNKNQIKKSQSLKVQDKNFALDLSVDSEQNVPEQNNFQQNNNSIEFSLQNSILI